jgi:hypothetical protein
LLSLEVISIILKMAFDSLAAHWRCSALLPSYGNVRPNCLFDVESAGSEIRLANHCKTFRTKRDAEDWFRRVEDDHQEGRVEGCDRSGEGDPPARQRKGFAPVSQPSSV